MTTRLMDRMTKKELMESVNRLYNCYSYGYKNAETKFDEFMHRMEKKYIK
jgi:hypothetical protein